jgi:hypothetical protein
MELLTDILAIAGWALLGFTIPTHIALIRDGEKIFGDELKALIIYCASSALSFALIAASIVLG